MKNFVGLLTNKNEVLENFNSNCPETATINFKTIDSIKLDKCSLLLIDSDIFESTDSIQFYLSKIRKKIQDTPVILILRINYLEEIDMDWFFNDFVIYPFRKGELSTRIKRLLLEKNADEECLSIAHLRIHLKEYSVYLKNQKLELTYKEFELLRLLVQNRGVVFTRKELLNKIWGLEYIGGTRSVDVHIRRLRGKLGDEFNTIIETVRKVGYRCKE